MPAVKLPSEIQPSYIQGGWDLDHLSAVPIMTGNSTPSGTASSSSNYSTSQPFWGFNNTNDTWTANGTTGWLKYDFGSGVTKTITKYSVSQGAFSGRAPYSWTFEGSNDDSNWTVLHTVTNDNSWSNYQTKNYTCSLSGAYRYYRINITLSGGASGLCEINKLGLYEAVTEFYDRSANGNTLTNNNAVSFREGFRQDCSAYLNSANSNYLSITHAAQTGLAISGSFSIFLRIKWDSIPNTHGVIGKGYGTFSGNNKGYSLYMTSGGSLIGSVGADLITSSTTFVAGRKYDILWVFDQTAGTTSIYVDGILDKSASHAVTLANAQAEFRIGNVDGISNYVNGQIEAAYVWNTALTKSEAMSMSTISDIFGRDTGGEEHLRSSASLNVKMAQSFNPRTTGYFDSVILNAYKNNSPTGNVWVTIETDSGGAPSGVAVATSELVDVSLISTSATYPDLVFRFSTPPQLTGGTTYWIVIQGDYSVSSTVGLRFARSSGGAGNYTGGAAYTYNGTSWSAISTDDFKFRLGRIVGTLIDSHFIEAGTNDGGELYSNGNIVAYAQNIKFTTAKSIKGVAFWLGLYGNPSGTLTAKLYSNSGGAPGTLLATSASFNRNIGWKTSSPSTYANGGLWYLEFANAYTLSANTEYFLVIEASAGGSGSDYNRPAFTSGSGYTSTYDQQKYLSGAWSTYSAGYDLQFALFEDTAQAAGNFFAFF